MSENVMKHMRDCGYKQIRIPQNFYQGLPPNFASSIKQFRRINNFIFPLKSLDISSWALTAFLNFLTGSFFKGCNYSKRIFLKKIEIFSLFYFLLNWFTYQNICNTPYIEVILKSFTYIINKIIVISYISVFNENYS